MKTDGHQTHCYDDLLHLPHHQSSIHPPMTMMARAAQFSPFAALTGHQAAIEETARLTDEQIELDEEEKEQLDEKLQWLLADVANHPSVTVTYFLPDAKKSGGTYETVEGRIQKIDMGQKCIVLMDGVRLSVNQIYAIDSPLFAKIKLYP